MHGNRTSLLSHISDTTMFLLACSFWVNHDYKVIATVSRDLTNVLVKCFFVGWRPAALLHVVMLDYPIQFVMNHYRYVIQF